MEVSKMFDFETVTSKERVRLYHRLNETKTGCLEWTGSLLQSGYGQVKFRGRVTRAHRIFYFMQNPKADQSLMVLHRCDNPKCCNAEHLFLGTKADNNQDKINKGRQPRGSKIANSKLNESQVCAIRDLHSKGFQQNELAAMFNVCGATIHSIVVRRTWKHIN